MDIAEVRSKIDDLDQRMLDLFLERMNLMGDVAKYKEEHHLPIEDRTREREVLARVMDGAGDMEEYAFYFFSKLMSLARARQNELLSSPTRVRALTERAVAHVDDLFPKTHPLHEDVQGRL